MGDVLGPASGPIRGLSYGHRCANHREKHHEWVLLSDMVDKWTRPFQSHFGPLFGDEAVQRGLLFPE